ncbi:SDR family oxidoreductase [Streptomyces sp. INA 01156]
MGAATCLRLAGRGTTWWWGTCGTPRPHRAWPTGCGRPVRGPSPYGDTADEEDVDRLFGVAERELGPVTGLVNNAAVTGPLGRFTDVDTATIRRVVDVNLMGTLLCSRRAAQLMTPRRGDDREHLVGAATLGSPGEYVHYAATKAAVDALTVGLAKELGPVGIRVNAVAPGAIDTDMHAAMGAPDRAWEVAATVPLRRPGGPRRSPRRSPG